MNITDNPEISSINIKKIFRLTNKILHRYYTKHSLSIKVRPPKLDELYTVILVPQIFSSAFGFRVSNNWEAFDFNPELNTVIIYHQPSRDEESLILSTNKLLGHIPLIQEASNNMKLPDYKDPYPKGIQHLRDSSSRVIAVGSLINYKFIYESNKDIRIQTTQDEYYEL